MAFKRIKYQSVDDNELPGLFLKGNENKVLAEVYRRFGHLMFGTCLKYLHNKQDAEDCVMEIMEQLPHKFKNHEIKYLKSWLYMVTKNACLMRLRKKNTSTSSVTKKTDQIEQLTVEADNELENKRILETKLEALEDAIQLLNKEQKQCIQLFYIEQKSYQEISRALRLPIKKVKSAIQNGKRNIKLKLLDHVSFKSA